MKKEDFGYELPKSLIASRPTSERTDSRLMIVGDELEHKKFHDIVDYLDPNDLLIINDTKVIKARLAGIKSTGGQVSILVERVVSPLVALCQIKASRPLKQGSIVSVSGSEVKVIDREGEFYQLEFPAPVFEFLNENGTVPLPPYIARDVSLDDNNRYQTVFADKEGAVAAPTAGLHFDQSLLARIKDKGIQVHPVTLHVGAGTFQNLRDGDLDEVKLHQERFEISRETAAAINTCKGRVIAVGTTVVRTLESWALTKEFSGETSLFIKPGFEFKVVDVLVTNFHLPESSLLILVSAFAGHRRVSDSYQEAIRRGYRFFSYGDAMLLARNHV